MEKKLMQRALLAELYRRNTQGLAQYPYWNNDFLLRELDVQAGVRQGDLHPNHMILISLARG
jgi:hypothetical protein